MTNHWSYQPNNHTTPWVDYKGKPDCGVHVGVHTQFASHASLIRPKSKALPLAKRISDLMQALFIDGCALTRLRSTICAKLWRRMLPICGNCPRQAFATRMQVQQWCSCIGCVITNCGAGHTECIYMSQSDRCTTLLASSRPDTHIYRKSRDSK